MKMIGFTRENCGFCKRAASGPQQRRFRPPLQVGWYTMNQGTQTQEDARSSTCRDSSAGAGGSSDG